MELKYRIIEAVIKADPMKVEEQLFLEKKYPKIFDRIKTSLTREELFRFLILNLRLMEELKGYPEDLKDSLPDYLRMLEKLRDETTNKKIKTIIKNILRIRPVN